MNDNVQYSVSNTEPQEVKKCVPPFFKTDSEAEAGTGTDFAPEYSNLDCTVALQNTSHSTSVITENQDEVLPPPDQCEVDGSEDIELRNVLDLEHVLTSMHGAGITLGRMEGGGSSLPLENELESVMRLENVLRKVNGNLSEFKSVEEALRKIHENIVLNDIEKDNECSENATIGINQMSDVELALQNDPLILKDDYLGQFSSLEEWASSQLKQQDDASSSLSKDAPSFTLKSEGEVMKSAKILFAKKTKTLFRWLHPKDSKADLRQRVDRAWDCLSPKEIEYYYSQVLGPFNHRQVKPMINPRIFELLNIPESLRPTAGPSCGDADAETEDASYQHAFAGEAKPSKAGKARKVPKSKTPETGLPRRKRGPYKKTLQALENSSHREKRRKRNSSSSSSSDREYSPSASRKRKRETKKKKITKMGKLRLKFCKMKTTKLPESSESDDDRDEEVDSDNLNPYKRCFGGINRPADTEISVELSQGLEACEKLLDSDNSM